MSTPVGNTQRAEGLRPRAACLLIFFCRHDAGHRPQLRLAGRAVLHQPACRRRQQRQGSSGSSWANLPACSSQPARTLLPDSVTLWPGLCATTHLSQARKAALERSSGRVSERRRAAPGGCLGGGRPPAALAPTGRSTADPAVCSCCCSCSWEAELSAPGPAWQAGSMAAPVSPLLLA